VPRSKKGSLNPPASRSLMTAGFPQSGGGATPGGGGDELRPIKANIRPTKCSGGQVANATLPVGYSTRRISATATSGRGANMWPN
jgi:hypothetical protein